VWAGRRPGPWTGRSLEGAGCTVLTAHPHGRHGAWAPRGARALRYPDPTADAEAFLRWLSGTCAQERIDAVLAQDEDVVRIVAEAAPDLGGTVMVGPDAPRYRLLCDKAVLPTTCALAGVEHPATAVVGPHGVSGPLPALPCIVKPARSGSGEVPPAVVARTTAERDAAVARITGAGGAALVQQRLHGEQWGVYCAALPGRTVGVAARVLCTSPRPAGTPSRFVVGPQRPDLVAMAGRLLASVGYLGMANLDVIEVDGRAHVVDVNLRPAASAGLPVHAGLDLAPMAVAAALELPLPEPAAPRRFTYVSVEGELGVLRDMDLRARLRVLASLARGALDRHTVLDPPPGDVRWLAGLARRALRG